MNVPLDRKYSETHEWFLIDGDLITVGITQFAADELTDITYVEMPEVGTVVAPDSPCGGIESVKAYAEIYCAFRGRVTQVNELLKDNPGLINEDAYDEAWIFRMRADDLTPGEELMSAKDYKKHLDG